MKEALQEGAAWGAVHGLPAWRTSELFLAGECELAVRSRGNWRVGERGGASRGVPKWLMHPHARHLVEWQTL